MRRMKFIKSLLPGMALLLAASPAIGQEFTARDATAQCSQVTTYGAVQPAAGAVTVCMYILDI